MRFLLAIRSSVFGLTLFLGLAQVASAQGDYRVIPVSNPGTITGTVTWVGPVPHLASFPINKDPEVCDPDSAKTRDLERLIIGPEGGVANTVVYLKEISGGKPFDVSPARRSLDQRHCRYEPHILLVPRGGAVQMKSSDAVLHTIHIDGAASFNLPFPFKDQVISRNMESDGLPLHLRFTTHVDECRDHRDSASLLHHH